MFWEAPLKNARKRCLGKHTYALSCYSSQHLDCVFFGELLYNYTQLLRMIVAQSAVQMHCTKCSANGFLYFFLGHNVGNTRKSKWKVDCINKSRLTERILHTVEHFIINNVSLLRSSSDKMSLHRQHQHHTVWRPKHTSVQPCAGLYVHHARRTKKNYFMHLRSNVGLNNLMTSYENLWVPQDTTRDSFLNMI